MVNIVVLLLLLALTGCQAPPSEPEANASGLVRGQGPLGPSGRH